MGESGNVYISSIQQKLPPRREVELKLVHAPSEVFLDQLFEATFVIVNLGATARSLRMCCNMEKVCPRRDVIPMRAALRWP